MEALINRFRNLVVTAVALWAVLPSGVAGAAEQDPIVIELTQVPCQFVESENGLDHHYQTTKKADCDAVNANTGASRLAAATVLKLKPGKYVFRVKNVNVPYDLGFWLRGDGLINRVKLPSVSGGGLKTGTTKDYPIELKPGAYVYSCPLNTTPDYKLVVTE